MQLAEFIDFDTIKPALSAGNKRVLLQQLSQFAAQQLSLDSSEIMSSVVARERLGSTGFGQGVAIPHGKIEGMARVWGMVARLAIPIDYKAVDGQPVDLVFFLLSPPDAGADHLKALAAVSRGLRHGPTLEQLRGAASRDALAAVLMGVDERDAA